MNMKTLAPQSSAPLATFDRLESKVRSYCRSFPTVFVKAEGAVLSDADGREYIDFLSGAGALNYGHNPPGLRDALVAYLESNGPAHALDMATAAKEAFLRAFDSIILKPREYEYKVQFTGPTGANAVEAALKLARKIKKRSPVIAFTNAFHGVTLGAVALTGNRHFRRAAGTPLPNVAFMPYDGYFGREVNTLDYLERFLTDSSSGIDLPAAIIVETVQGEGGVNVARTSWLKGLERLCQRLDILLIVDDIQAGCGRTGSFFSFEEAGISPDIVTLSKSLSGYGLPMSVVLMKPELDVWKPSEHNGTFRGNNLAFVTATEALRQYWRSPALSQAVRAKAACVQKRLKDVIDEHPESGLSARGRGLIQGLVFEDPSLSARVSRAAFGRGLIIETSGAKDEVVKVLPPLTIPQDALKSGMDLLAASVAEAVENGAKRPTFQNTARGKS